MKTKAYILIGAAGLALAALLQTGQSVDQQPLAAPGAPGSGLVAMVPSLDLEVGSFRQLSSRVPEADEVSVAVRAAHLEALVGACEARDQEAVGSAISAWLNASPDPVGEALACFDALEDRAASAEAAGLLLQACMYFADKLPAESGAWTRAEIAAEILARHDSSPRASRVVRLALAGFASEVPVEELRYFVQATGSDELQHADQDAGLQRMFLIQELAVGMPEAVVDEMSQVITTEASSPLARSIGVNALLLRDWRQGGERATGLLAELEGVLQEEELDEVRSTLGGRFIELHGRDRLELLREVVADDRTTDIALGTLDRQSAELLDAFATEEDRSWDGYAWVELALGGERGYRAGLDLFERLDGEGDHAYAAQVLGRLLEENLGAQELTRHLERRFEARNESADPYWGTLLTMSGRLDEAFVYAEVLPRLERTQGESSLSRHRLLGQLDRRFPDLGLASL